MSKQIRLIWSQHFLSRVANTWWQHYNSAYFLIGYSAICHIKKSQYWLGSNILTMTIIFMLESFWHDNPPRRMNDNKDPLRFCRTLKLHFPWFPFWAGAKRCECLALPTVEWSALMERERLYYSSLGARTHFNFKGWIWRHRRSKEVYRKREPNLSQASFFFERASED